MIRWAATRPAVVWAFAAGLTIAGGVAFTKLPLATKTTVDLPTINISAMWRGASPELTETYLTSPIEAAVQGVQGVRKTSSTSNDRASVRVELDPETDITMARLAILERMETLRRDLPVAAQNTVVVSNYVPEELDQQPLLEVNVTGPYTPGASPDWARTAAPPTGSSSPTIRRACNSLASTRSCWSRR
jgi:multidrug efflux pump subunit AcrB